MISSALTSAVYEMNFLMRSSSELALDTGSSTPISSPRPGQGAERENPLLPELTVGPEALIVFPEDVDELLLERTLPRGPGRGRLEHDLDVAEVFLFRDVLLAKERVGVVQEVAVPVHDPGRPGLAHLHPLEPVAEFLRGGRGHERQLLGHPVDHRHGAHLDRILAHPVDGDAGDAHEDRHDEIGGHRESEAEAGGDVFHSRPPLRPRRHPARAGRAPRGSRDRTAPSSRARASAGSRRESSDRCSRWSSLPRSAGSPGGTPSSPTTPTLCMMALTAEVVAFVAERRPGQHAGTCSRSTRADRGTRCSCPARSACAERAWPVP